jgi:hypothetical protein
MKTKLMKKIMSLTISTIMVMGMSSFGVSAEWRQGHNGWWNAKGQGYSIGWENVGGNWFFFDKDGYMKTGWISEGGKWYYLNPNGNMATGWLQDGNKWYYLNGNGDMAYNAFIAGYKLGSDGAWIDGNFIDNYTTTGAAVNITTGPAVIIIPEKDLHKEEKEIEKLNKFFDKMDDKLEKRNEKLDKRNERMEKKEDK